MITSSSLASTANRECQCLPTLHKRTRRCAQTIEHVQRQQAHSQPLLQESKSPRAQSFKKLCNATIMRWLVAALLLGPSSASACNGCSKRAWQNVHSLAIFCRGIGSLKHWLEFGELPCSKAPSGSPAQASLGRMWCVAGGCVGRLQRRSFGIRLSWLCQISVRSVLRFNVQCPC